MKHLTPLVQIHSLPPTFTCGPDNVTFAQESTDASSPVAPQNNDTDRGDSPGTIPLTIPPVHHDNRANDYSASGSATEILRLCHEYWVSSMVGRRAK
jgi:hypothetical protein